MSIVTRFFGKKETVFERGLVTNSELETTPSLQVLFEDQLNLNIKDLETSFRSYHHRLAEARLEIDEELHDNGIPIGLIGWGKHVIQIVGFDSPMPVESCIAQSHYPQELKEQALAHRSHLMLFYKGYDLNPINQYASMAIVAGFLSKYGAIVVGNEAGNTSFPAAALCCNDEFERDIFELLETLPLAILYCGFSKYEVEGIDGVWVRTYGASLLGLPDMASLVQDHSFSQDIFDIFENVFSYLLESGATFIEGNTMQVSEDEYMKIRLPTSEEYYLENDNDIFVVEFIAESEIN
jgi:Domain of unknown function (DUF4261)